MCLVWWGMNLIKVSRQSMMIGTCTLVQKSERKKKNLYYYTYGAIYQ